jgi:twitching motility protein PilI
MDMVTTPQDIISLLQDMERRSNHMSDAEAEQGLWSSIGFRVADTSFIVELKGSSEIFPLPEHITPVPKSQDWVFGLVNLRGELMPVFDLNQFLGQGKTKLNKRSRVMVINHPEMATSVLVDEVFGLKHFQHAPQEQALALDSQWAPYVSSQMQLEDKTWYVFNFNQLIEDERFLNAAA